MGVGTRACRSTEKQGKGVCLEGSTDTYRHYCTAYYHIRVSVLCSAVCAGQELTKMNGSLIKTSTGDNGEVTIGLGLHPGYPGQTHPSSLSFFVVGTRSGGQLPLPLLLPLPPPLPVPLHLPLPLLLPSPRLLSRSLSLSFSLSLRLSSSFSLSRFFSCSLLALD